MTVYKTSLLRTCPYYTFQIDTTVSFNNNLEQMAQHGSGEFFRTVRVNYLSMFSSVTFNNISVVAIFAIGHIRRFGK